MTMTRTQLTGIAKELGCWGKGKPISMEMGTVAMEVALRGCRPAAGARLSADAAAFFEAAPYAGSVGSGQPTTVPPKPSPFLGTGPTSPAAPAAPAGGNPAWSGGSPAELAAVADAAAAGLAARPLVVPPKSAPIAHKDLVTPVTTPPMPPAATSKLWTREDAARAAQQPAATSPAPAPAFVQPPAIGAKEAFRGYDVRGLGMMVEDCTGSIALNNAVCCACPEAEQCLEQAMDGVPRYPERWRPELTGLETAMPMHAEASLDQAASAPEPEPPPLFGADEPTAPVPATTVEPVAAPEPKAPKTRKAAAPAAGDVIAGPALDQVKMTQIARGITTLLCEFGLDCCIKKNVLTFQTGGVDRVRLQRITAGKPKVMLLRYSDPNTEGLVLDTVRATDGSGNTTAGDYSWDPVAGLALLEQRLRQHLGK